MNGKKYSMFVGRWQPWHEGHQWLIDQRLKEDKNILICIRDVERDEKNPWTAQEIHAALHKRFKELVQAGRMIILVIPDIESINYGRDVGYDIMEHVPPENIKQISATKIREQLKNEKSTL